MFAEGAENPVIADIWKNAPKQAGQNSPIKSVDITSLVKDFGGYYRLEGSLTMSSATQVTGKTGHG